MTLQDKLDAFRVDFESGKPPFNVSSDIVALMHRATQELKDSGQADTAYQVGETLPDFELQTDTGQTFSSTIALQNGPLVVSFYRGVWCPYCNMELQGLQDSYEDIKNAGAELVVVSPQTATNSRKSAVQNKTEFPILVDEGNAVARELGLVFKLPEYLIEGAYKKLGANLDAFNGDDTWELPMPARYVVGRDGVIVSSNVNPDYTVRPDPKEIVGILEALNNKQAA